jgi:hypothetical protein
MADNLGYTPGSGATVATEEVGGVHHQKALMEHGGADGVTPTVVSDLEPLPVQDEALIFATKRVLDALESPRGYDKSLTRQRVTAVLESGTVSTVSTVTTVTTVTTVSAVTNIAGLGGDAPQLLTRGANMTAWAQCVRALIT